MSAVRKAESDVTETIGAQATDRFFSLPQAAKELGCSRQTVMKYAAFQRLESEIVAGNMVVTKESVAKLKAELCGTSGKKNSAPQRRRTRG